MSLGGLSRPFLLNKSLILNYERMMSMKKFIIILSAILIVFIAILPVLSAESDFVVEDGVLLEYVGNSKSITIPSSVSVISDEVFINNTSLESVTIPDSVLSIGDKAFYGCTSLGTISGGDNVKYVGALAFVDTAFLLNSDVEFLTLGAALISYNGTQTEVSLPDDIKSISPYAFLQNDKITSFCATDFLTHISEGAFYDCKNLSEVNITTSVSFIGPDAFYNTQFIKTQSDFVVLGDSILVAYNGSESNIVIPDTVKQIAPNAFYENKDITSVKIPNSVFVVCERAFMGCSSLSSVELSNGLMMIDNEAFALCSKLETLTTPATLSVIGKGAFIECDGLKAVFMDGNNLFVDYGAFAHCDSLETALLSNDVSSLMDKSFSDNKNLKSVTLPSGVVFVTSSAFDNCSALTAICDKESFADDSLSGSVNVDYNRGDANIDHSVDIMDATCIQLYIAGITEPPYQNFAYMDADFDAGISILDATYVQLYIAKLL